MVDILNFEEIINYFFQLNNSEYNNIFDMGFFMAEMTYTSICCLGLSNVQYNIITLDKIMDMDMPPMLKLELKHLYD